MGEDGRGRVEREEEDRQRREPGEGGEGWKTFGEDECKEKRSCRKTGKIRMGG